MAPCVAPPLETVPSDVVVETNISTGSDNDNGLTSSPSQSKEESENNETKNNPRPSKLLLPSSVQILGELVGACNLTTTCVKRQQHDATVVENNSELRPYCVVKFGKDELHATKKAEGNQPIWTLDTQSLFLLQATPDELATHKLEIAVYSKHKETNLPFPSSQSDNAGMLLGSVTLDGVKLLSHCNEERFEVDLQHNKRSCRGTLALRFRIATESDAKFVKTWNKRLRPQDSTGLSEVVARKQRKDQAKLESRNCLLQEQEEHDELSPSTDSRPLAKLITEADETQLLGNTLFNTMSFAFLTASTVLDRRKDNKVHVKPHCDETRPDETTYMTPQQIKEETYKPSTKWTEAGSGTVGRLFLEVLSCDDLPNVDVGEAVGNVTDSFVAVVYEDALVQTPVIDDELSPCWMPWTERAFIFNMMHPASTLYLGCFDYDIGPLSTHDPIGRAAINISNLKRDTEYTLKYNLYPSASVTDRTSQGTITIRLRIEMNDEKAAILAAMKPRPKMHVNVHKEKSFNVVQYTCYGVHNDETQFDLTVLRSYVNEVLEYKRRVTYSIGDALTSLVFWRGQVKVGRAMLPIDSFLFFWAMSTLVEKPQLLPAFLLLSVSWILLANMRLRTQHPSPWNRCPSFWHYLWVLKTGEHSSPQTIDAWEGWDETKAVDEAYAKRLEDDLKTAEKKAAMQNTLNEIGDDTIKTSAAGSVIPIDLLERLGRYQGIIGGICRKLRFVRIILLWEESIVSFWITAIFLLAGIIALFLPWGFILTWLGRIVVYGFLGPHMKLVDMFVTARAKEGEESLLKFHKQKTLARIRREDALKLKAVKSLRFGHYITLVPNFNLARHYDRPLPQSTARPFEHESAASPDPRDARWLPGQQLYGAMIPRPEIESTRNHELAMEAKDRLSLLEARLVALKVAAMCGGGVQDLKNRLRRLKDGREEEDQPDAMGYELIACGDTLQHSDSDQGSQVDVPDMSCFAYDGMSLRCVSEQASSDFTTVYELGVDETPKAESLEEEESDSMENYSLSDSSDELGGSSSEGNLEGEGIEIVACEDEGAEDAARHHEGRDVLVTDTDSIATCESTEVIYFAFQADKSRRKRVAWKDEIEKQDVLLEEEDVDDIQESESVDQDHVDAAAHEVEESIHEEHAGSNDDVED